MKKRSYNIVLILGIAVGFAPVAHTADSLSRARAWASGKTRAAQQHLAALSKFPKEAVRVAKKKYVSQQALTVNEQKTLNRLQAGTLAAILSALAAIGYVVTRPKTRDLPTVQGEAEFVPTFAILEQWGLPTDIMEQLSDAPVSRFLVGAKNAAAEFIGDLYELVPREVLGAGRDIAQAYYASHAKKRGDQMAANLAKKYKTIADMAATALRKFNPINSRLIYAATTGLDDEVQALLCGAQVPSTVAIQEAAFAIKGKAGAAYERIEKLLTNPNCSSSEKERRWSNQNPFYVE